jgi:hypothetical protein
VTAGNGASKNVRRTACSRNKDGSEVRSEVEEQGKQQDREQDQEQDQEQDARRAAGGDEK